MTTATLAKRIILERVADGTTILSASMLALPMVPDWCDGKDAAGRAISIRGAHILRQSPGGEEAVNAVLAALAEGYVPDVGVHAIDIAPQMAAAQHEIVAGRSDEVMIDGERGTGKTLGTADVFVTLAEQHLRAGHALPLKVLSLHDSLASAAAKSCPSYLEGPWAGLWQIRDSGRAAVFVLGGVEYVVVHFVGVQDATSAERLKSACHMLHVEEAVPSLSESGGVDVRSYEVGRSSMRLPTRRRVSIVVTNPGPPDHWCYQRFLSPGRPRAVRCRVPASDRLSAEDVARLEDAFRDSPDLRLRLARGEWAELQLGPAVTPEFRDEHIAPERLRPVKNVKLWLGHDGGLTPCTIIGARYQGSVLVYAALASERAGTRQHALNLVLPWLSVNAPGCLEAPETLLEHRYDPSMATGEQADIDQDPVRVLREMLGGSTQAGAVKIPARLEPITALLGRFNTFTGRPMLQIDPVDAVLLIRALRGRWYFPTVNGVVSRDAPVKNHPWSDLGDSFAYMVGGMAPSRSAIEEKPKPRPPLKYKRILGAFDGEFA